MTTRPNRMLVTEPAVWFITGCSTGFGRVDVLVNIDGIDYFSEVEESEENEVRKLFGVNVFGTGRMIWAMLPGMRRRRSGWIVNFSSLAGLCGFRATIGALA